MIIDGYAHMFHESSLEAFKKIGGNWVQEKVAYLSAQVRQKPALVNVEDRLGFLDRNHVDMQIVTPPHFIYTTSMPEDIETKLKVAQVINDGMAKLMDPEYSNISALAGMRMPPSSPLSNSAPTANWQANRVESSVIAIFLMGIWFTIGRLFG